MICWLRWGLVPWLSFWTTEGLLVLILSLIWLVEQHFSDIRAQLFQYSQDLEIKNRELRTMDQMKDEFLANTSHELRTPLNGIIGIVESMLDGATGEMTAVQKNNLVLVVLSGKRLAHLVNDILDFSKLKNKDIVLQIKPVNMRQIADIILKIMEPLALQKSLKLNNLIPDDFPDVAGDENRLQQILYNLVGNAIKFTDKGEISVTAMVHDKLAEIAVNDTGIGIPKDKFEQVFAAFDQVDASTSRQYGGTGLGLAITRQLVDLHGGTIGLTSELNHGSTFYFTIPVSQETAETASSPLTSSIYGIQKSPDAAPDVIRSVQPDATFNILIVDDEPVNLQVLVNYLSLYHYAVTQASNGREALDLMANGLKPDLILLDVMMPKMTGYEVCRQLREQFPASTLPVILLTAKNRVNDLTEGFNSGANDYLTKPFFKQELLSRISMHLEVSQMANAYTRFVPREFLDLLGKDSILNIHLGDQVKRDMTILFSDIRSFTSISEKMTPEQNFKFLNSFLNQLGPVVREHHGFIDKYIGDAIMALFDQSADNALDAAIGMLKALELYNAQRQRGGEVPIRVGIGLNTGELMLGTIGEQGRMEGTVISDAVNLASRIEGMTKMYQVPLLISEQTRSRLSDPGRYATRFVDRVKAKGKEQMVTVYEVFNADLPEIQELKHATRGFFEEGWHLYQSKSYEDALKLFKNCQEVFPQDPVAQVYVHRCEQALSRTTDLVDR
ncbi:MAG: response regulator [SAR324 cluster bacterium]|nr:response regulator [SAR324 cluster bacterium]